MALAIQQNNQATSKHRLLKWLLLEEKKISDFPKGEPLAGYRGARSRVYRLHKLDPLTY